MKLNNDPYALPLADLGIFVAVAEAEGFSAAALRLRVSKAMVSTAIARLEDRLGARLFQRTTRRLSLTEAGAAALPHAQTALVAAQEAADAATQSTTTPRGTLRLNAPMSFGLTHVAPALAGFSRAYPEVRVDLVLDDRVLDLVDGGFDLAVRIGTLADSSLIATRIATTRNLLVAAPSYLAGAGALKQPRDLTDHAALVYSLSSSGARWTLTRGKRRETVRVKGPLQANSSLALKHAALEGLGIASLPSFLVGEELANGRLARVLPAWSLPEVGVHVITTTREYLPPKTRAFIDFFRATVGAPPYWEAPTTG